MSAPDPIDAALSDPWGALRAVIGDPLHPGGTAATEALLERADVGASTRLLDIGCGGGTGLRLARQRGARALGLDREPLADGAVKGELSQLPVRTGRIDVALAECVLCLADSLPEALAETRRVLAPGGRLAFSDVVLDGPVPEVPDSVAQALCLTGTRSRETLQTRLTTAGFTITGIEDHHEDLLALRDRAADRVDYEGLLRALGDRGRRALEAIRELEAAVEDGRIGYVSLVAVADQ